LLNVTSATNLTGIVAGTAGQTKLLVNVGTANLTLVHQSTSSTAPNRFFVDIAGSVVLLPNTAVTITYDAAIANWRIFTASGIPSNVVGIAGATGVANIVAISQAAYDALVTKDASTLYFIV
jgi:hypothetical protein